MLILSFLLNLFIISANSLRITDLKCQYLNNPKNIDSDRITFTWSLESAENEAKQSKYNLSIFDLNELVWTSGWTDGSNQILSIKIPNLKSNHTYISRLEVLDNYGNRATTNSNYTFSTGIKGNWSGKWITDKLNVEERQASSFFKSFTSTKTIQKATFFIASAGFHEVLINNQCVSDFLSPSISDHTKKIYYKSYDVTGLIETGTNSIQINLGNGWFNHQPRVPIMWDKADWRSRPSFIVELILNYADGTWERIISDETWISKKSSLVANHVYLGESYDQSIESSEIWELAIEREQPTLHIVADPVQPIIQNEVEPSEFKILSSSNYLYKFPINFAGNVSLQIPSIDPQKVTISYGEQLVNGHVNNSHFSHYYSPIRENEAFQTDYLFVEDGNFVFKPKFSYKGFQFLEIKSNGVLSLDETSVKGYSAHTDMKKIGSIYTSNPIINDIYKLTLNSYLSNAIGFFTDCPTREKNGWTGDAHLAVEIGLYNYESIPLYIKYMDDHVDAQEENGNIPMIVPSPGWGYNNSTFDWTYSMIAIPWNLYLFTGDESLINRYYPGMKNFLKYWDSKVIHDYLMPSGLGDWQHMEETTNSTLTTSILYYNACVMFYKMAATVSKNEDAKFYYEKSIKIREKINDIYFGDNTYSRTITELAMGLYYHVVADSYLEIASSQLHDKIIINDRHLVTGILGTKALLVALSENGYENLAYEVATKSDKPSLGYLVKSGATSLPENLYVENNEFYGGSRNHVYFGTLTDWYYVGLAGINPQFERPGFSGITLKPILPKGLEFFSSDFESIRGKINSSWTSQKGFVNHKITIPPGSEADYLIPEEFSFYKLDVQNLDQRLSQFSFNGAADQLHFGSGSYTITLSEKDLSNQIKNILINSKSVSYLMEKTATDKTEIKHFLSVEDNEKNQIKEYSIITYSSPNLFSINGDTLITAFPKFVSEDQISSEYLIIRAISNQDSVRDRFLQFDFIHDTLLTNKTSSDKFEIYPNPTTNTIYIKILPESILFLDYYILQLNGSIIQKGIISLFEGNGETEIDVAHLVPGMYVLHFPELEDSKSFLKY